MTFIMLPEVGFGRFSKRPEEILLLCWFDPNGISTVPEIIACLQALSQYSVSVLNLFEHPPASNGFRLPLALDFRRFAGVVIHNTMSYSADNLRSIDRVLGFGLSKFEGVKILFKQDENYQFKEIARYIGNVGFDVVFTCMPVDGVDRIYPPEIVGTPRFVRMLTGYVTPTLRSMAVNSAARPIDIGYRGSIQPLSFGRLGYEKRKIGDDVEHLLAGQELTLDISSRWEDRIGGMRWFEFLASCKATLGVESGASIFDLHGDLDLRCSQADKALGEFRIDPAYSEAYLDYLKNIDGNVFYNQVSPRHFEAIATRTLQLLYPGNYSGILRPGEHYFPLERDYSNLQEGVEFLLDESKRRGVVNRAYEEVLLNEKYWIETFVQNVDNEISLALEKRGRNMSPSCKSSAVASNVLLIAAHEPRVDPRLDWISSCAPDPLKIHQCGVLLPDRIVAVRKTSLNGSLYLAKPRQSYEQKMGVEWLRLVQGQPAGVAAVQELLTLNTILALPKKDFEEVFSSPAHGKRADAFRWYIQYILDTSASLLSSCLEMRGVHAVIATDLDTLLAALVLKAVFKIPIFYDAHEYWAESEVDSLTFERAYWISLEKRLIGYTDYRQTVSPGLAKLLGEQYSCSFSYLPNCEPLSSTSKEAEPMNAFSKTPGKCYFLFQGGFAVGRGLDLLIDAWKKTDKKAILLLRGRETDYKIKMVDRARKTGLLGVRIFFPEPVDEADLIRAASDADVGLAPYPPSNNLYANCSPNKLSQYMAAGIPILANDTHFVREVVKDGQCGLVVDFSNTPDLVAAVDRLVADDDLRARLAAAARAYHATTYNWQKMSVDFYRSLKVATGGGREFLCLYRTKERPFSSMQKFKTNCKKICGMIGVSLLGKEHASYRARMIKKCLKPLWLIMPSFIKAKLRAAMTSVC